MSVFSTATEFWQNISHGGEFFTQVVFTAMATMLFSSRAVDFLVVRKDAEAENLLNKIKAELEKELMFEEQNKQYSDAHKKVAGQIKKMDDTKAISICSARIFAGIFLMIAVFCLINNKTNTIGMLPLAAFLPFGIIRLLLNRKLSGVEKDLEKESAIFRELQVAYDAKTKLVKSQSDSSVEHAIQKRTPRRPKKSKADAPTSVC